MCALYGGLGVRRGRKLSPCAGGERGAFGAGGGRTVATFFTPIASYIFL